MGDPGAGRIYFFQIARFSGLDLRRQLYLRRRDRRGFDRCGREPWLATVGAIFAGALAGMVTGLLNTKLKIPGILAGILTQIALYSVNLRIMGSPNLPLLRKNHRYYGYTVANQSRLLLERRDDEC